MITRRGFILFSLLALTALLPPTDSFAKSCLWKVTSDNSTLYLQGSIHILKPDNYPLAPEIEAAYADSDVLVFETDIKQMSEPETQQKIMAKALLPGTETLQQALDADTYQMLSDAFDLAGLPILAMNKFKPWFATTSLTLIRLQKIGFDPQHGLDIYFHGKAATDGKKIVGLESIEFQIDLFDTLSNENPNSFVSRALEDLSVIEGNVSSLEEAWESGDIDAVNILITKSFEGYPEFHKSFVLDRNDRWLETLIQFLASNDTYMVVVGTGHLSGEGGLLQLLKNKGCVLEQL